jgi:hypothetical protein
MAGCFQFKLKPMKFFGELFGRSPSNADFPKKFRTQRVESIGLERLTELDAADLVLHLRDHPLDAQRLLSESYSKRYSPSTYIEEGGDGFRVGWFSRQGRRECVREFSNLADAATDYLLFSLGKGRWHAPPKKGP